MYPFFSIRKSFGCSSDRTLSPRTHYRVAHARTHARSNARKIIDGHLLLLRVVAEKQKEPLPQDTSALRIASSCLLLLLFL